MALLIFDLGAIDGVVGLQHHTPVLILEEGDRPLGPVRVGVDKRKPFALPPGFKTRTVQSIASYSDYKYTNRL